MGSKEVRLCPLSHTSPNTMLVLEAVELLGSGVGNPVCLLSEPFLSSGKYAGKTSLLLTGEARRGVTGSLQEKA